MTLIFRFYDDPVASADLGRGYSGKLKVREARLSVRL